MRKLASIQRITAIRSIPGADKIEVCNILGWEVVVAKSDGFKVGDLVVYVEVDSILPERPEFEFLRKNKFRIKTIKIKQQISQGIVFPLSILPPGIEIEEGKDVTDILQIRKYEASEVFDEICTHRSSDRNILSYILNKVFHRFKLKNTLWPTWIPKTDEIRVQNCHNVIPKYSTWYITEKLDGTSATFFVRQSKFLGIKRYKFGICSRNIYNPNNLVYHLIAKKYDIKRKLISIAKDNIIIQGEIIGPKIQKNKYKLNEIKFYIFNVIENGRRYEWDKMIDFCKKIGIPSVPFVSFWCPTTNFSHPDGVRLTIKELIDISNTHSLINPNIIKEGIVVRALNNPHVSFKVINPHFLLKHGE